VPVGNAPLPKLQLDEIEPLEAMSLGLLRPGRPYELHILVQPGQFHPGFEPEIEVDSIEGGGFGLTYHGGGLLGADDRYNLGGRISGAIVQTLDGTTSEFRFTRAIAEGSYETPPIGGLVRPSIHLGADLSDRQRADLHLESFHFAVYDFGAQALIQPFPRFRATLGTGIAHRLLYDMTPQPGFAPPTSPLAQTRLYGELSAELTLDPENLRRDQHHSIYLGARVYNHPYEGAEGELFLLGRYQKVFAFNWNELWLELRGISRSGFVLFPEEESLGDNLRGTFSNEYTRKLGLLALEFRYSLMRDVIKMGVFHNLVGYQAINRTLNTESFALADSFGLGFHALLLDGFQLDAYYGFGFASGGKIDHGASLYIRQAY
jgi:hypothetical protein